MVPRLESLTALRFVLAMWVVFYHYYRVSFPGSPDAVIMLVRAGASAVGFFYMLSGFVLFINYAHHARVDTALFLRTRFARVYPVYALALVWTAGFSADAVQALDWDFLGKLGLQLFAMQSWYPPLACHINCPGWSISNEAFFYALFPFLLPLFRRPAAPAALLGLAALCWAVTFVAPTLALQSGGGLQALQWATYNPVSNAGLFVLGIILGKLHGMGWPARRLPASALALGLLLVGVPAAVIVVQTVFARGALYINLGALAPLYAAAILLLARASALEAQVRRNRLLLLLGEASYAMYILQLPMWLSVQDLGRRIGPELSGAKPLIFALEIAGLIAVSILVHRAFEKPVRRWLMKSAKPRDAVPVAAG